MDNITRTAYGLYLQDCNFTGAPFQMLPNTTLNERFNIQAGVAPAGGVTPKLNCFTIGLGGHRASVGVNGVAKVDPIQHESTHSGLYTHLPFVLRETNNDISAVEQRKYALRREEMHNGTRYYAYYAKRLSEIGISPALEYTTVSGGISNTKPFEPTSNELNPVPPVLSPTGVNVVSGDYVSATSRMIISLDAGDVSEILNASKIIYGDEAYAIVSEIGLCSGVDKIVTVNSNLSSVNFTEVIACQIVGHVNCFFPLLFNNEGFDQKIDVGAVEPLFRLQ